MRGCSTFGSRCCRTRCCACCSSVGLYLSLDNNFIGNEGVQLLSTLLKVNGTLRKLHLGNFSVITPDSNHIKNEGAKYIIEGLKENKVINDLRICILGHERSLQCVG
eukprot:TRINITY_DN902_c0_g1_i2.p1 TRINITY_DN902_c0_g1~~TRINITY_DN902_c0_g1_i2.p1  ORF type:complete len:107 (+),score=1.02 TRINITY_DN902_c0_g1_i2:594-914(+)